MKLDAKTVNALRLEGKSDVIFFDEALPRFGYRMRAGPDGKVRRTWVVQYRPLAARAESRSAAPS